MKAVLFLFFSLFSVSIHSQVKYLTSIDIEDPWIFRFGESPKSVMSKLNDIYSDKIISFDGKDVTIYDIRFGGINYNYAIIKFHDEYLWSIEFTKIYELTQLNEVRTMYAGLIDRLKVKYNDPSVMKEDGVELAKYWEDSRGMVLMLHYEKNKSVKGEDKYYLCVQYYNSYGLLKDKDDDFSILDEVM